MSEHRVAVRWKRQTEDFTYDSYNREHTWVFDGGPTLNASAAPDFLGKPEHADPEQAFVAALSSCHMLTFLALAAKKRIVVDRYEDEAVGFLEKNEDGKLAVTRVILRPRIGFQGEAPDSAALEQLHHRSHEHCFIANSVKTVVTVESGR